MKLTPQSCAAVADAARQVASNWNSGFENRGKEGGVKRRRRRVFKTAARAAKNATAKAKSKAAPKHGKGKDPDEGKKVKKVPLPKQKLGVPGTKLLEFVPKNFSRSDQGSKMIRQSMQSVLDKDKVAFPTKPMFDLDTGVCRVKYLMLHFQI